MSHQKHRLLRGLKNNTIPKCILFTDSAPVTYSSLRKRDKEIIDKYYSREELWIELLKEGERLWERGEYGEGIKVYRGILGLELERKWRVMVGINLGKIYQQAGMRSEAIGCYVQIINLAPKILLVYNRLLVLLSQSEEEQEESMLKSLLNVIQKSNVFKNTPKTSKSCRYQFNYAIVLKRINKVKAKEVLESLLFKINKEQSELLILIKKQLFQIYQDLKLFSQSRKIQKQLRAQGVKVNISDQNIKYYEKIEEWRKSQRKENRFKFKSIDKYGGQFVIRKSSSIRVKRVSGESKMRSGSEKSEEWLEQSQKQNKEENSRQFREEIISKLPTNTGKIEIVNEQEQIRLYSQLSNYKQPKSINFEILPIITITSPKLSPEPQTFPQSSQPFPQYFIQIQQPISPILTPSLRRIQSQSNSLKDNKSQLNFSNPSSKTPFQTIYPQTLLPIQPISLPARRQSKLSLFSNSRQNYQLLAFQIQSSLQPKFMRSNKKSLTLSSYTPSYGSYQTFNSLNYAVGLMEKDNYKKAKSYLKKALNDQENDKTIVYDLLGNCYQSLGKYQTALSCWSKIVGVGDCEVYLKIERVNRKINRMTSSISILKLGLERFPKNPKLFQAIGWIYLQLNEIQKGLNYLQKANSLDSKSYSIKVKLAYAYFLKPSTSQQCKQTLNSLKQNIQQPDQTLKILLSHILHLQQNPNQSMQFIKKLYQEDEMNQNYLYLAGKTLMLTNDFKSAFEYLKKSIIVNPAKIQSYTLISTILCAYGYPNQALNILKQCLKVTKSTEIYQLCGRISYINRQFIDAIKYYKQAFAVNHKNYLLNSIADCYHYLKKHNKSIIYYRRSLSLDSNQPSVYKSLAFLYQHVHEPNKSIKYFDKCIDEYKIDDYQVLLGRIKSYILRKQYGQSILFLQQLLQTHQNKDIYNSIGFCYYNVGSYSQSISMYIKSLEHESNSQVYFNIGVCFNKLNDTDNTQKYYLKCLEQNSNHSKALYNYGILLFYKKQSQCIQYIEKALKIVEKQEIFRIDGNQLVNNEENYVVLADIYLEFNLAEKVIKLCMSVLNEYDLEKFYYFLIKGYLMVDNLEKANSKYQELCVKYPNSTDILRVEILFKDKQKKTLQ